MRGSVTRKGDKWYIVVFLGNDPLTGKKKYRWFSGYATRKAAERALPTIMQEANAGALVEQTKERFGPYLDRWLEDKSTQVRPTTIETYRILARTRIIPSLGNIELTKLRPQQLQSFYTSLLKGDNPLSNRSVQFIHIIIHGALAQAVKWGIVTRNVADMVVAPRPNRSKGSTWTLEQAMQFVETAKVEEERVWVGFFLAVLTGMRRGELLGLRWSDVDSESATLHVRQTLVWTDGTPSFFEPKTERSRRSVALPREAFDALRVHKAMQNREKLLMGADYLDHGLVFCRPNGLPFIFRSWDRIWKRCLDRSGLPPIRFHDLRHTHASLLLQQGVHPKIVSERLGHSTVNITLDTYSHVLPGLQREAADTFAQNLLRAKKDV